MKYLGVVKWFNQYKGFGIIEIAENEEVFLHHSNLDSEHPPIEQGTTLLFRTRIERKKISAVQISFPNDYNDFIFILSHLSKPNYESIKDKIKKSLLQLFGED